ncbi:FMN reductase [Mesorhizobium sp. M0293]|uniref:FMN reductase n=1 Tax=Mesorhizobium sp. M0293 TaxID=2956930 RepID=UPI00333600EB
MTKKLVVGISGNLTRPSKTNAFISHIVGEVADHIGATSGVFDIEDLGPSLPAARSIGNLDLTARSIIGQVLGADVLVVGTPTFKGSYTGLFKHFFDLLDPASLRGKPVILAATGGGERHSLIVEHQLRPLFGLFEALTMPTAIYASDKDFANGMPASEAIQARARQAVAEVSRVVGATHGVGLAA